VARAHRGWLLSCTLLAAPVAALSVCRAIPWPWPTAVVQLLSFTPWLVVPAGLSLLCAAVGRRRWALAAAGTLLAVQTVWLFAPGHATASPAGGETRLELVTMSINAKLGRADANEIVRLVRDDGVGLLAVQEHTPALEARLAAAGLRELLPYRITAPAAGAGGGALYSQRPLTQTGVSAGTRFPMATARLELETAGHTAVLEVTNVHTRAPVDGGLPQWRRELALLENTGKKTGNTLLLGDFNASYDHLEFRRLATAGADGAGLVDVGTAQGARLVPTWPQDLPLPGTTLDHLLTSRSVGSRAYSVHRVAGTDHAAVVATLSVPARQ
jgi:endonuclease/exonuclease/phosphatase family metal-dependent hydrolase